MFLRLPDGRGFVNERSRKAERADMVVANLPIGLAPAKFLQDLIQVRRERHSVDHHFGFGRGYFSRIEETLDTIFENPITIDCTGKL